MIMLPGEVMGSELFLYQVTLIQLQQGNSSFTGRADSWRKRYFECNGNVWSVAVLTKDGRCGPVEYDCGSPMIMYGSRLSSWT